MQVQLPWGSDHLTVEVPDSWTLHFPEREGRAGAPQDKSAELQIVRGALDKPLGARALTEIKFRAKRILIIVDDITRPTPVHKFFHLLLQDLKKAGANFDNITVVPALGIHTPMSREEMAEKIGEKNLDRINWDNHYPFDVVKLQFVGETSRGTRVVLNRLISEADFIITIGLVEPHLWAGFGGGMKNILPGLASAETIGAHHSIIAKAPYMFSAAGIPPEKNPFRQELEEVKGMIEAPIFCLNVVIDHDKNIVGAFAGNPISCHREAVKLNNRISGLRLDRQMDGIIVNSFPMDINFKQSMKGVGNSLPALRPGGAVMGFLRAERGLDDITPSEDYKPLWMVKTILRLLGPSRVYWFLEKVKKGLNVEEKFLVYYSMQLIRAYDLFFYVPTVTDIEVKKLGFFVASHDPQGVIDQAVKKIGPDAHVAVFREAGATFPIVTS